MWNLNWPYIFFWSCCKQFIIACHCNLKKESNLPSECNTYSACKVTWPCYFNTLRLHSDIWLIKSSRYSEIQLPMSNGLLKHFTLTVNWEAKWILKKKNTDFFAGCYWTLFYGFAFCANMYLNLFYYLFSLSFVLWKLSGRSVIFSHVFLWVLARAFLKGTECRRSVYPCGFYSWTLTLWCGK